MSIHMVLELKINSVRLFIVDQLTVILVILHPTKHDIVEIENGELETRSGCSQFIHHRSDFFVMLFSQIVEFFVALIQPGVVFLSRDR